MYVLEFALIIVFGCSLIFDLGAQYVRASINKINKSELFAVSNWVQYQARILNMLSVVSLSYYFEKGGMKGEIKTIFYYALSFSFGIGLLYITNRKFFSALSSILFVTNRVIFKNVGTNDYFFKAKISLNKYFYYSLIVNILLYMAMIVPFVLASLKPDIRMTLAYSGQLLNFMGTIINYTLIEPGFYRAVDERGEESIVSQFIFAKLASIVFVVGAIAIL